MSHSVKQTKYNKIVVIKALVSLSIRINLSAIKFSGETCSRIDFFCKIITLSVANFVVFIFKIRYNLKYQTTSYK